MIPRITIASDGRTFIKGGAPFFMLADTVWSAFTNASEAEWIEYLGKRRSQGFNTLQINILPQWDRSAREKAAYPFEPRLAGSGGHAAPNAAYFDRAERMVALAADYGMTCALVLLWCDYVPDTWASKKGLGGPIMPLEAVTPYVEYVARRFAPYAPIYLASGDTDFETGLSVSYYAEALRALKRADPGAIATLHTAPQATIPPPELIAMMELDFLMYQSGHGYEEQYRTWDSAEKLCALSARPVVNGEPCYEGHKHGMKTGRFGALDLRRAFFQSILTGAKAGFTYGAHGLWGWHHAGETSAPVPFSGTPYLWRDTLDFQGAWDCAWCAGLLEAYGIRELEPAGRGGGEYEPWFLAADPGRTRFALYLPASVPVELPFDASGHSCDIFDLSKKRAGKAFFARAGTGSVFSMPAFEEDVLVLGRR